MATLNTTRSYAQRIAVIIALIDYLTDMAGGPSPEALRLGITIEQITALRLLYVAAAAVFVRYNSPETKTSAVVKEMREASKAMWDNFLELRRIIVANPTEKTPLDRESFLISEPSARTPSKIPIETVIPTLVYAKPRTVTVRGARIGPEAGQLKNLKNASLVTMFFVQAAGAPEPAFTAYQLWRTTTKNRVTLTFLPSQIGDEVWIVMAFKNAAGRGPWSRAIRFIII